MSVLDIVGKKDDPVPPQSSKFIIDVIENKDKKLIEFPTAHVGLWISKQADEKWLAERS
jgi:polyhydroxyalkanoate synthase subunit PhaC